MFGYFTKFTVLIRQEFGIQSLGQGHYYILYIDEIIKHIYWVKLNANL